MIVKMVIA